MKNSACESPKHEIMNSEDQTQLARALADLLAKLHPEVHPLVRLHLSYWLVRRIKTGRAEKFQVSICKHEPNTGPSDYQI